jgi:hypothetical protein
VFFRVIGANQTAKSRGAPSGGADLKGKQENNENEDMDKKNEKNGNGAKEM